MTKEAALYGFFSGFGIPAFATQSPADTALPYLVYEPNTAAYGDGEVVIVVNLWYHGEREDVINAKAREISQKIGMGGIYLPCDGGAVIIRRGTPFAQAQSDAADDKIRGRYITLTAEYITPD
nr:MAG TPA: hypothetical protein [Caudoviricetes sp.]